MKRLICVFCILLIFTGCTASYLEPTDGDKISPIDDYTASTSLTMPLYFRYYNEPMLVRCEVNVEISPQHEAEYYAVTALLAGATGQRTELNSCFSKKCELVEMNSNGEYLYVTLSGDFLTEKNGQSDAEARQGRRLALYSIVNTVTEMGRYSMVQFYVMKNKVPQCPDSFEVGIAKNENESAPLGVLSRNGDLILTPANVARAALEHYSKLEWERLYYYLASSDGSELPLVEDVSKNFEYYNLTMSEFSVDGNYTVSENGKSAIVNVSFKIRTESTSYTVTNAPLELVFKAHNWYVSYESLLRFLGIVGG